MRFRKFYTICVYDTFWQKMCFFFRPKVLIAHDFVGLKVLLAHLLVGLDRAQQEHVLLKPRAQQKHVLLEP